MKQFLSICEASEELGLTPPTVRKMISEIRDHIPERYSRTDIFEGNRVAIRFVALQDWAEAKRKIDCGIKPEPYDPIRRERELGILPDVQTEVRHQKIDTDAIAEAVCKKLLTRLAGGIVG